jgi:hypothetical protein
MGLQHAFDTAPHQIVIIRYQDSQGFHRLLLQFQDQMLSIQPHCHLPA